MDADRLVDAVIGNSAKPSLDRNAEVDALLEGAIVSLKKPLEIPGYNKVSTEQFKKDVGVVRRDKETADITLTTEKERYGNASEAEKRAIEQEGQAKADKVRADQARAEQEAGLYAEIISSLGVNPSDIAAVGARLRETRPVAEAKLRAVQEAQRVSLLDNPLEWLANQLILPSQIDDYNREADVVNALEHTLSESIGTANSAAALNAKSIPTITAAQGKAEADKELAAAAKLKAQADERLSLQNVTFAQQRLANDITLANLSKESTQIDIQQAHLELQAQIQRINVADSHATRQLRAAELLEKLQKTKGLDVILENYDRIMGHPKGTTSRYNFEKFGESQRVNITAIGAGSGGTDPFQALVNISQARPGPGFTSQKLFSFLQEKAAAIAVDNKIQMLDEKQKPMAIAEGLKRIIDLEKAQAYKPGSIFYEASPAEMIASGTLNKDSEIAKVLEPFAKQGQIIPTGVIVAAIEDKWKNPTEAGAVLADYYKKNVILRNSTQNYRLAGITPDSSYKVPIKVGMFNGSMPMDLTKPEEATKMILFMRSQKAAAEAYKSMGPIGKFN